jgi:hypothetical protein
MSHVVCTRRNRVNSQLLVIRSQTANLIPGLDFGHNLCYRCPNGWCEPISEIYVSICFQWYKKLFEEMGLDPWNRALKIRKFIWDSNSQHGSSLGSVRVHSFTLFALLEHVMWLPGLSLSPQPCNPLALVVSPRLRLRHFSFRNTLNQINIFGPFNVPNTLYKRSPIFCNKLQNKAVKDGVRQNFKVWQNIRSQNEIAKWGEVTRQEAKPQGAMK